MLSGTKSQVVDMAKSWNFYASGWWFDRNCQSECKKCGGGDQNQSLWKQKQLWLFCFGRHSMGQSKCREAVGKIRQETKAFPAVWWIKHEYAKCFSFLFYTFFIGFQHGCEDKLMVANLCTKSLCRGLLWRKPEFNEEWGQWVGKHEQSVGECGSVADIQRWYR